MKKARPVLPTGLLALLAGGRVRSRNEAWTRERVGADESSSRPLAAILRHYVGFSRGYCAAVSVNRRRLQGIVSARPRDGREAWEIDHLAGSAPDYVELPGLLESVVADCGKNGALKLFLRLERGSPLLRVALETGFSVVRNEVLYSRRGTSPAQAWPEGLRAAVPGDAYLIYRLYNACLPEQTRRQEAATFGEWHAAQERRWLRQGVRLVVERDGHIEGVVTGAVRGEGASFDLLADQNPELAPGLVEAAASRLGATERPLTVLLPESSMGVARRLEDAGFEPVREYVSLMRRTTRPLPLPKTRPAIAKNAVGV